MSARCIASLQVSCTPADRSRRRQPPPMAPVVARTVAVDVHADRAGRVLAARQLVPKVLKVPWGVGGADTKVSQPPCMLFKCAVCMRFIRAQPVQALPWRLRGPVRPGPHLWTRIASSMNKSEPPRCAANEKISENFT